MGAWVNYDRDSKTGSAKQFECPGKAGSWSHLASLQSEKRTRRIGTCISVATQSRDSSGYATYFRAASGDARKHTASSNDRSSSGTRCRSEQVPTCMHEKINTWSRLQSKPKKTIHVKEPTVNFYNCDVQFLNKLLFTFQKLLITAKNVQIYI